MFDRLSKKCGQSSAAPRTPIGARENRHERVPATQREAPAHASRLARNASLKTQASAQAGELQSAPPRMPRALRPSRPNVSTGFACAKPRHVDLSSTLEIAGAGPAPTMTQILVTPCRPRNGTNVRFIGMLVAPIKPNRAENSGNEWQLGVAHVGTRFASVPSRLTLSASEQEFFDGHAPRPVTAKPSAAYFRKRAERGVGRHERSRLGSGFNAGPSP